MELTAFILRLIPTTITPHVLRFTVMIVSAAVVTATAMIGTAEHLVEEAELGGYGVCEGEEDEDECGEVRHFWNLFPSIFGFLRARNRKMNDWTAGRAQMRGNIQVFFWLV